MLVSVCLLACLLTPFCSLVLTSYEQEWTYMRGEANEVKGHASNTRRWSRSTTGIWSAAIRALLRDAKEVPTKSRRYRKYVKQGTKEDAFRDYTSLEPTYNEGKEFSFHGVVGDYKVQLRTHDNSQRRQPSLSVSDPNGGRSIRIVYEELKKPW